MRVFSLHRFSIAGIELNYSFTLFLIKAFGYFTSRKEEGQLSF